MGNVVEGAKNVVALPVAAVKAHPIVWLVVAGVVILLVLRYRGSIQAFLAGKAPAQVRQFART